MSLNNFIVGYSDEYKELPKKEAIEHSLSGHGDLFNMGHYPLAYWDHQGVYTINDSTDKETTELIESVMEEVDF